MLTWLLWVCRFLGMNLIEVKRQAQQLLNEHGLAAQGWTVDFNNRRGAAGVCRYRTRRIEFSIPAMRLLSDAECIDTVTHEVAHAIVGGAAGHGPVWKAQHRAMGGSGRASVNAPEVAKAIAKWRAECKTSNAVLSYRNRLTSGMRNATCTCHSQPVRWIPNS